MPPAQLAPSSFAERLYAALEPLADQDEQNGWALLIYCNAIGAMFQQVEELVRDTDAGDPGWTLLLDLNRCPTDALPWLAQFAGVRLLPNSSDADMRARIASTDGFRRGTRAAMVGAAAATLTGAQTVVFRERDGAAQGFPAAPDYAYYVTVRTYAPQTPDPAATLRALLAQKPGGIVLAYDGTATGQIYAQLRDNHVDYAAVNTVYPSYAAARDDMPA